MRENNIERYCRSNRLNINSSNSRLFRHALTNCKFISGFPIAWFQFERLKLCADGAVAASRIKGCLRIQRNALMSDRTSTASMAGVSVRTVAILKLYLRPAANENRHLTPDKVYETRYRERAIREDVISNRRSSPVSTILCIRRKSIVTL